MMDENSHPPTKMPSLDKNDGTDTGLPIDQSNVMTNSPLESLDSQMVSNTSKSEIPQAKSGNSDGGAEQEDVAVNTATKRKRYQRHSQHQIQELEAYFMDCPHPNEKQRKVLSEALGLEPLQVKFWFQNKRTQMKAKHERHESTHLRSENDKLKADNERFKELLANLSCPTCGDQCFSIAFHENKLRLENARLKQELERISSVAETIIGRRGFRNNHTGFHSLNPLDFVLPPPYSTPQSVNGEAFNNVEENVTMMGPIIGSSEVEKPFIIDIALGAMEEFVQMAHLQEPLWFSTIENGTSLLNEEEYFRRFPRGIGPRPIGFITEATRETAVVIMNPINLVEIIMDVNYWSSMFAGVVSRVSTIDVLSAGVPGNYNGAIQVILAEIQVPTPQVPTRECYFVRYCKHRADGTWAIVDVSLDHLRAGQAARCRKRPSGCFIEQMPNGYSKVAWVEHVEVDNTSVPDIYKPLLSCGLAFGAKRWLATLDRQCERLASAMATHVPTNDMSNGLLSNHESRKSMLKLVERMVNSFTSGVSASTGNQWTTLSSGNGTADNVRVMTRISLDDPGKPPGIVLCAATSIWLPVPPNAVFEFLRDQKNRAEWDILSNGGTVEEMAHMANGREIGNCVSFLKVNGEEVDQSDMLILQESSTDPAGSYVIYAPVDVSAMNLVLNGGEPDHIALLPSGFAILPDGPPPGNIMSRGSRAIYKNDLSGSLLTVAFQILVDSVPTAKFSMGSIATVNSLIACTITRIKRSLLVETGPCS